MKIIKHKLIDKNMQVKELAELLKCNQQTITNWINDRNTSNIKLFVKLCKTLDISINEFN